MKRLKQITKEQVWLGCIVIGAILAYAAIYSPVWSILALVFLIIGFKGVFYHVM